MFFLLPPLLINLVPLIPFQHPLVKSSLPILAPILAKIVNGSLSTGHVPSPWKRAIILPKLKKTNLDPIFSNYRPLSNLSFISKLAERAASIQIVDHLTLHHLFSVMQSAYRKHHSTETALLKVMNDNLLSMNRQPVSLLVLLDLSSAFDTVDHTILPNRLQAHFGICDSSLSMFESYLFCRTQFVLIKGYNSSNLPIQYGIPQGFCLGPFSLAFIPVLFSFLIVPTSPTCIAMPTILRSIFSVGESRISSSKEEHNLGTWLNKTLSMSTHVSKVASSCFF